MDVWAFEISPAWKTDYFQRRPWYRVVLLEIDGVLVSFGEQPVWVRWSLVGGCCSWKHKPMSFTELWRMSLSFCFLPSTSVQQVLQRTQLFLLGSERCFSITVHLCMSGTMSPRIHIQFCWWLERRLQLFWSWWWRYFGLCSVSLIWCQ